MSNSVRNGIIWVGLSSCYCEARGAEAIFESNSEIASQSLSWAAWDSSLRSEWQEAKGSQWQEAKGSQWQEAKGSQWQFELVNGLY